MGTLMVVLVIVVLVTTVAGFCLPDAPRSEASECPGCAGDTTSEKEED